MADDREGPWHDERRRGRCPTGLVGMLALMVAVEVAFARASPALESLSAADWVLARRAAASPAVMRAEVLCVGDSLLKMGVIPVVVEDRLDRPVYNLAALGAAPPATYALLKRALDAGARPRAIVLDAKAAQLSRHEYRAVVGDWSLLLDLPEAFRFAWIDDDLGLFGLYVIHLLPTVRLRSDARRVIVDRLAGRAGDPPWRPAIGRQYRTNRGAVVLADRPGGSGDPAPDGALTPGESAVCYPDSWTPWPTNVAYLDKTLALAASRSIPAFFVIPPAHPAVQARRESLGLDADYVALVRRLVARYENVTVVDGRHAGFPPRACFDGRHLNSDGAAALSRSLAEFIACRLDDGATERRWVELPPYEAPTIQMAAEDLETSRSLVARRATRR